MIEMYTPLSGGDQSTPTETPDYHAATCNSKKELGDSLQISKKKSCLDKNWTRVENNNRAKNQKVYIFFNGQKNPSHFCLFQRPPGAVCQAILHVYYLSCVGKISSRVKEFCENQAKNPGNFSEVYGILHNCMTMTWVNKYRSQGPLLLVGPLHHHFYLLEIFSTQTCMLLMICLHLCQKFTINQNRSWKVAKEKKGRHEYSRIINQRQK